MSPYKKITYKCINIYLRKVISIAVISAFVMTSVKSPLYAQTIADPMPRLPVPGIMVNLSPVFTPAHLMGITIHPDNALQFDFLIHQGDQILSEDQKVDEYKKLVKYFLASLTIPDEDQWVNLSPYEKNRIIKDDFGKTEMGRDLLAEDYLLKQITSSLIYPENGLGKKFWDTVYKRAWDEYHTTNIPVNTFNKVWIVPDQALVYEKDNSAYILQSHLKVMLEEDYLSLEKHAALAAPPAAASGDGSDVNETHAIGSQVIREIILPELEKEVNEGKNFASLRQMYSGMVLATWYKKALMESLLGKVYADKARVKGVDQDPKTNELIYTRYLKAFRKGVFNYIKDDVDKYTNESIPRKYFSGGFERLKGDKSMTVITDPQHIPVEILEGPESEWTPIIQVIKTRGAEEGALPNLFEATVDLRSSQEKLPILMLHRGAVEVPIKQGGDRGMLGLGEKVDAMSFLAGQASSLGIQMQIARSNASGLNQAPEFIRPKIEQGHLAAIQENMTNAVQILEPLVPKLKLLLPEFPDSENLKQAIALASSLADKLKALDAPTFIQKDKDNTQELEELQRSFDDLKDLLFKVATEDAAMKSESDQTGLFARVRKHEAITALAANATSLEITIGTITEDANTLRSMPDDLRSTDVEGIYTQSLGDKIPQASQYLKALIPQMEELRAGLPGSKNLTNAISLAQSMADSLSGMDEGKLRQMSEDALGLLNDASTKLRTLLLGAADEDEAMFVRVPEPEQKLNAAFRGLVIDDEDSLSGLLKAMLKSMGGFKVDPEDIAHSAKEALDKINADPKRYAFIITDNNMPGMTGYELSKVLMKTHPDIPVIIHTGNLFGLNQQIQDDGGLPKNTNIKQILEKPTSGMQAAGVVNELRKEGKLFGQKALGHVLPAVMDDAQALQEAQRFVGRPLAAPEIEGVQGPGEYNWYLDRNVLKEVQAGYERGDEIVNIASISKIKEKLWWEKVGNDYRIILRPETTPTVSNEQEQRVMAAVNLFERVPVVPIQRGIEQLANGENSAGISNVAAIGNAIDMINGDPPGHFLAPETDQKAETQKAMPALQTMISRLNSLDEVSLMPDREKGLINYRATKLAFADLSDNLSHPVFTGEQRPWLLLSGTNTALAKSRSEDPDAYAVGINEGETLNYDRERRLVINYIGKLLDLEVVQDGDRVGLRNKDKDLSNDVQGQRFLVSEVNAFLQSLINTNRINWADLVERQRREGADVAMTSSELESKKSELDRKIEDLKTAIRDGQDVQEAVKFLDDPLLVGGEITQVNYLRSFFRSHGNVPFNDTAVEHLGNVLDGLKIEFSRFYSPQVWDLAEDANHARVQALIDTIKREDRRTNLPKVIVDSIGYLEEGLQKRKISPQQVEMAIDLQGETGLKWFMSSLRKNPNYPVWEDLLNQLQAAPMEQRAEIQNSIRKTIEDNLGGMKIADWNKMVDTFKQRTLISDRPQRFLIETKRETERRLYAEGVAAKQVITELGDTTRPVYIEQKGPGMLSGFVYNHLIGTLFLSTKDVDNFMAKNWVTHEFFVPIHYYNSQDLKLEHVVDFLADFVSRHNRENPNEQLELVQQNGSLMTAMSSAGGVIGIKNKGMVGFLKNSPGEAEALRERLNALLVKRAAEIDTQRRQLAGSLGTVVPTEKALVDFNTFYKNIPFQGVPDEDRIDVIDESLLQELGWDFQTAVQVVQQQYQGKLKIIMDDGVSIIVKKLKDDNALTAETARDHAMNIAMVPNMADKIAASKKREGGIDLNSANLTLQIKRDGNGVPLPLDQQDMAQLGNIQGFIPEIVEIKPAVNVPIINELRQKIESSLPEMANPA